jgi:hypothetical protein
MILYNCIYSGFLPVKSDIYNFLASSAQLQFFCMSLIYQALSEVAFCIRDSGLVDFGKSTGFELPGRWHKGRSLSRKLLGAF